MTPPEMEDNQRACNRPGFAQLFRFNSELQDGGNIFQLSLVPSNLSFLISYKLLIDFPKENTSFKRVIREGDILFLQLSGQADCLIEAAVNKSWPLSDSSASSPALDNNAGTLHITALIFSTL